MANRWSCWSATMHGTVAYPQPAYMAPECYDLMQYTITYQSHTTPTTWLVDVSSLASLDGHQCNNQDIYSYGVMLWEMLAGCRPWDGIGAVGIACQLCQLLQECWDKDPERRPAAAELAKRLMLVQQKLQGTSDAGPQVTCS
ncbi:Mitogen-activated protein kinase kinase kinase 10 [Tetrabaena socialis]|uniref:Mitogen-activated protein kinase kinase kinase 10 n=1 Tax=Tetrabaena socialis TaxID=47790 RepID=A0A2J8A411_9CHLO|nr:Mitogen-activated protein kinase kinase kinase 10 [Tetrabaena socialis]|eukprot:PNH07254.1 Mitogen-activated protein kinase kinase kinase 10 [Tetrabaena socialis]